MTEAQHIVATTLANAAPYQDKFNLVMRQVEGHLHAASLHYENGQDNLTINRELQIARQLIQELKNFTSQVGVK